MHFVFVNTLPDVNNRCSTIYLTVLVLKKSLFFFWLPDYAKDGSIVVILKEHINDAVYNNCEIIDCNYNWPQLRFLEAFSVYTRNLKPTINEGLKASRELD